MAKSHVGGSFAPPLSDEHLDGYGAAVAALPGGPVKDACETLLACCRAWWDLPEPAGTAVRAHPSGVGSIVDLHPDHAAALDPHIPWSHELKAIQSLFDDLPTGTSGEVFDDGRRRAVVTDPAAKAVRDMAFHLLWHVVELDLGREPLTADRLPGAAPRPA